MENKNTDIKVPLISKIAYGACMYFFSVGDAPVPFYIFSCLAQFFFSGIGDRHFFTGGGFRGLRLCG